MKRFLVAFVLVLAAVTVVTAQAKKGPVVDKVYFDVRTDESIGMKDAAEGKTDIFLYGVSGRTFNALPADTKAKLDVYNVPSSSLSVLLNPIPNKAPYTHTVEGKTYFNPFAVREIRLAINFLISRKQIIDEILGGAGTPMYTMATPGQPGTYKYNLVTAKYGFTATGNEQKALADINSAMTKASELAELKGKLVKKGQWWEFNGEPVTLKFVIRVDDPNVRLPEGRYIANQVEKAGLKVERLELDRTKCLNIAYYDDPAKYAWHLYTEGWSAGATRAWWSNTVCQMYAPWYGNMPGGATPEFWNYQNEEIDAITQKNYNGQFLNAEEFWTGETKAIDLGLYDAVRIYIATQNSYFATNKDRFNARMAYGLGDGLNEWSIRTADVKPEKDGTKILRVTQFSARGGPFMSAWDPVGVNGFNDVYSGYVVSPLVERGSFESPNSAIDTPLRATWKDVVTNVKMGKDKDGNPSLMGQVPVPETAILYDSASKSFKPVGKGVTSFSKATATYKWGVWHTGRPIGIADVMYAQSFVTEWMTKDGEGDKYYEAEYESTLRPQMEIYKGFVINQDGTITTYYNYNWPMDKARTGSTGVFFVSAISASGQNIMVSWEICEALSKLVAEGGKSGTAWSFSADPAFVEVDVKDPKCVADIRVKLQEFVDAKYVPPQIKKWKTVDDAVKDYQAAIKFIDDHKNAFISNGPFLLNTIDLQANFAELAAFRNAAYPYASDFWPAVFKTQTTRIDQVSIPTTSKDKDLAVAVKVSAVEYPSGVAAIAGSSAKVKATLIVGDKETVYTGTFVKDGVFSIKIPSKDMSALKAGSYTLIIETSLKNEAPAVSTANVVVF